jgi:DNA-binding sugar fermentation-stimulating protein
MVNMIRNGKLFEKAINAGKINELGDYKILRREVQYKNSRLDFLLSKDKHIENPCFLEVKSVSLVVDKTAMFADTLKQASNKGVGILAYKRKVSIGNVEIYQRVDSIL